MFACFFFFFHLNVQMHTFQGNTFQHVLEGQNLNPSIKNYNTAFSDDASLFYARLIEPGFVATYVKKQISGKSC